MEEAERRAEGCVLLFVLVPVSGPDGVSLPQVLFKGSTDQAVLHR